MKRLLFDRFRLNSVCDSKVALAARLVELGKVLERLGSSFDCLYFTLLNYGVRFFN